MAEFKKPSIPRQASGTRRRGPNRDAAEAEHARIGEERRKIAQMLHDGPCQTLCGAYLLAQLLIRDTENTTGDAAAQKELAGTIDNAVKEIRDIINELRRFESNGAPPAE